MISARPSTRINAPTAYPFLVLQDAVRDSAKYFKLVAIVNVSILASVAFTWLGVCIAAIIQIWEFLRYLRKRTSGAQPTPSFGAQ